MKTAGCFCFLLVSIMVIGCGKGGGGSIPNTPDLGKLLNDSPPIEGQVTLNPAEAAKIKGLLEKMVPDIVAIPYGIEQVEALREYFHWTLQFGSTMVTFPVTCEEVTSFIEGSSGAMCLGHSAVFGACLQALGYPVTLVGMYHPDGLWNHASIRVWVSGKWCWQDSSLGVGIYTADGVPLSFLQAREALLSGEDFVAMGSGLLTIWENNREKLMETLIGGELRVTSSDPIGGLLGE